MTESTKTILIVAGVVAAGYFVYTRLNPNRLPPSPIGKSTSGVGNSVGAATKNGSTGSTSFWDTLGSAGRGLNAGVSSVESLYNSAYDLFGGTGSTSTNTGQGNNGTAG